MSPTTMYVCYSYNGYRRPCQAQMVAEGKVEACLLIGLLDHLELGMEGFVNGIAAQRCIAPLTKADSSNSL